MAKSEGKEESKSIVQKIVDDYQMVSHEHNRGWKILYKKIRIKDEETC